MTKKTKKIVSRSTIKVNEKGVWRLLAALSIPDGMADPGFGNAVRWGKECFYVKRGNETRPLTPEEVSKNIRTKGFTGQL